MQIRYFAWLREKIGVGQETLDLPAEVRTVGALIAWLQSRDPGHAAAFANPMLVRCAIDQDFAGPEASILGAGEIAFFPPMTGG